MMIASNTIDRSGGRLRIMAFHGSFDPKKDFAIDFEIPPAALDRPVELTMAVHGSTLSQLQVDLVPDELVFQAPTQLMLWLGEDLVDTDLHDIQLRRQCLDGRIETVPVQHWRSCGVVFISAPVFRCSHFSLCSARLPAARIYHQALRRWTAALLHLPPGIRPAVF